MQEKRCPRCKETKLISEFGKDRRNKDGLNLYCKVCKKRYNDEQKQYRTEYYSRYHKEHRLEEREYSINYRKDHPDVCRKNNATYYARVKSAPGKVRESDVLECLTFFNHECAYSGVPLSDDFHLDHVVPVSKSGANEIHNRVPCLPTINLLKAAKNFDEWYPTQSFYSESRYNKIKEWMKKGEV